jgi:sugar lactone lactonase YvrE/predicted secreted protein
MTVTVTIVAAGVVSSQQALTVGKPNAEFVASAGTCVSATSYTVGQQCTVVVTFEPKYPGNRNGAVVILNSSGTLLGSTLLSAIATGSLSVLNPGEINTVAGVTDWLYGGDGVLATNAPIFLPMGVALDGNGNLYLADANNDRIRKVNAQTGLISTIAGNGTSGYAGDGGPATSAMISNPAGLALDGAGNLYFADSRNDIIRRVDAISGIITTVAGTPQVNGYAGNGQAATSALLSRPEGVSLDAAGDLFIADTGNHMIREVSAATGKISTVAGTGAAGFNGDNILATNAELNGPWSVSLGADGTLYIADTTNQRVREVNASTGMITTIAGTGIQGFSGDGAAATSAQLNAPVAVLLDPAGNLYIADSGNNRIRQVSAATANMQTLSGTSTQGFSGDGGPANVATMYGPYSLFFDQSGNLLFADMFNNRVREIYASVTTLPAYPVMRVGKLSVPQSQGLVNDGNAVLTIQAPVLVNAALDPATTTCNTGSTLNFNTAGNSCNLGVDFAPTTVGTTVLGSVTVPSNAGNSPSTINISGDVLSVQPTSVSLVSSLNPSLVGNTVTFTATVSAGGNTVTGTIAFLNSGTPIAGCSTVNIGSNQKASCSTSTLPLGSNPITASYSGDANDASSNSSSLQQVVKQPSTVVLTASPSTVVVTANVTLTATVTAATGTPTGTVIFYDGTTALGSTNVGSNGVATFSTNSLAVGSQSLTAQYSGDSTDAAATSAAFTEVVQQATTATTLTSSNATATVGNSVTLTATVTSVNGPAPQGTVKFMSGSIVLGTATVGTDGTANLSISSLVPGSYSIIAVYGGDTDDATSSSTALAETIQQVPTATTLIPSANPVSTGATLNLSATVTATGSATNAGTLGGNITFTEGSTVYGTVGINASGQAILPISTLSAGTHYILATYVGTTNYATSSSAVLTEVVLSTATVTTLSSPSTTTLAGEPATFTAVVTSATATPTGTVVFEEAGASIGQTQLNAQGIATFTTTTLPVGTQIITAEYAGNGNYNSSTSAALTHIVVLATPALILNGPGTAVNAGSTFGVTATLSSNGVAPTGTLTLHNGGTTIGTQTVSADGTFSFANLGLGVGTYQLTASYSGDASNSPAVSMPFTLIVQLTPTVTALLSSANPSTFGQSVTFTATTTGGTPTPTGVIQFLDGTTVLGSSAVNAGGTATLSVTSLAFGTHSITASYVGDLDHAPSVSNVLTEKIVEPAAASLTSSLNPSIYGQSVVLTVKVAGVQGLVPTGTVTLRNGSSSLGTLTLDATGTGALTIATLPVGSNILTAGYSGDTNYSTSRASLTQTVQSASTQVSLTLSQNPAIYQTPVVFTSTVTGDGGIVQEGSVNFTDSGVSVGNAAVGSNGIATLSLSTLAPGTHSIVANYVGDGSIEASSSTPQVLTVKELTTTALTSSTNPASTLTSVTLTASVTNSGVGEPTGTITFSDGSNLLGTATLNGAGVASLTVPSLAAGNHSLVAAYNGDGDNFSSTSTTLTQGVQLRPTTTALSSSNTDPNNPLSTTLISVVSWSGPATPTGTVTFTSGSTVLGSTQLDSIGVASLTVVLSSATESIVATYNGDASYASSASLATTISSGPATQFTLQVSPSALTLQSKQHAVVNVSLSSISGFSDTLQLGCLGLPDAATCTFSTPQIKLAANGTATAQLYVDTGDPLGAGSTSAANKHSSSGTFLCLMPCLLGLGLGARRRKMIGSGLLIVVALISITLFANGCSGLQVSGTPPGTYSFKVTASGAGSGATISQTMTLTVTQ